MKCPYCNEKMVKGYIYGYRYALEWLPAEQNYLLAELRNSQDIIRLEDDLFSVYSRVEAHTCHSCGKIIIDINEKE